MIFLVLSIIFLSGIFVTFKIIENLKLPVLNIVVINYFIAVLLGSIQSKGNPINLFSENWINYAVIIGVLFFIFFILIGKSIELVGLSTTTVASKMSVVIPIIFSILYYAEDINTLKIIGILLAISGVIFTVYKKDSSHKKKDYIFLIPLILFVGLGITDFLFGYTQKEFNIEFPELFNSIVFLVSFLSSLIYVLVKKQCYLFKNLQVFKYGVILGLTNYLGVYFFMKVLGSGIFDSSIIFGLNNVSIVILSALISFLIFKEKASVVNIFGITFSVSSIIILSLS